MLKSTNQSGFTLIEALIAFLILTIGLLGASLFHTNLLSDSGESKARAEAMQIASRVIEDIRGSETEAVFESKLSTNPSDVVGKTATFSISIVSAAAPSSIVDDSLLASVTVSWTNSTDDTESVALQSLVTWLDPSYVLQVDEAGVKSNANDGVDSIDLPGGKAQAVVRRLIDVDPSVSAAVGALVSSSSAVVSVVVSGAGGSKAIELIKLNNSADPVLRIDGFVVNNANSPITSAKLDYISQISSTIDPVIDIRSSAGSNCVIYYVDKDSDPQYGKYVCLLSEGWFGNISVVKNELGSTKTLEDENNYVCYSSPRGYKYLLVEPHSPSGLSFVSLASVSISEISSASYISVPSDVVTGATESFVSFYYSGGQPASLAIVGQSGLVRFVNDGISGYHWGDYFWQNPNLVSTGLGIEAGNVDHQNFFVTKKIGAKDTCGEFVSDVPSSASTANPNWSIEFPKSVSQALFGSNQPITDINNDDGDVILGYSPVSFTISGNILLKNLTPDMIRVIGNPEPVVTINCEISTTSTASGSWPYSCGIPVGWTGAIIAQPSPSVAYTSIVGCPDSPDGVQVPNGVTDLDGDQVVASTADHIAYRYYPNKVQSIKEDQNFGFAASGATCSF